MKDNIEEIILKITNDILFKFIHNLNNFLVVTYRRLEYIANQNTAISKELEPVFQNINALEQLLHTFRYKYREHLEENDKWTMFKEGIEDRFFHDLSSNLFKTHIDFKKCINTDDVILFQEIKSILETFNIIMEWKDFVTNILYPIYRQDNVQSFEVYESIQSGIYYSKLHGVKFVVEKHFDIPVFITGPRSLFILAIYLTCSNIINIAALANKVIHISTSLNTNVFKIVITPLSLENFDFLKINSKFQKSEQLMLSKRIINDYFYGQFSFEKIADINRISIIQRIL